MEKLRPEVKYGDLPEQYKVSRLIAIAHSVPKNWFGRRIAHLCKKMALLSAVFPLDTQVEGIKLRTFLRDNASERNYVFTPWRFDFEERAMLAGVTPKDGVFVDIGANIGIYSLWMAKHMSAEGRIIAFEPNPPAFARLQFNVEANAEHKTASRPEILCLCKGVSDKCGEFSLYLDPENLGGSSLVMHQVSGTEISVECVTLYEQLLASGVDRIDALKIDIEGAEDLALIPFFKTAPVSLYPRVIAMERVHRQENNALSIALEQSGYRSMCITKMNQIYTLD